MSEKKSEHLTAAEKARIERNRLKALNLRQAKLICHPYSRKDGKADEDASVIKVQGIKYIDSGGGFLLEKPVIEGNTANGQTAEQTNKTAVIADDAISIPVAYEECLECGDKYADSFLFSNFGFSVCDKCREPDERHTLITRTEAKAEYLLQDCDFDRREPILRFIRRKNPHHASWGEMKLYLHMQVQQRAMEVWGSEEELMRQHELRVEKREIGKVRKYNKQMKQLRMEVRSSLYTKETKAVHVHEFGPETYNEADDTYTHVCSTCSYKETYEKM